MELKWAIGVGPATTGELADEVEAERRLYTDNLWSKDNHRCLWGVIQDSEPYRRFKRDLVWDSREQLHRNGLRGADNNSFVGTPEERCAEMVRRLRAIP